MASIAVYSFFYITTNSNDKRSFVRSHSHSLSPITIQHLVARHFTELMKQKLCNLTHVQHRLNTNLFWPIMSNTIEANYLTRQFFFSSRLVIVVAVDVVVGDSHSSRQKFPFNNSYNILSQQNNSFILVEDCTLRGSLTSSASCVDHLLSKQFLFIRLLK